MKRVKERLLEPPVFCEQCPSLAMALVEDSPLCHKCMAEAIRHRSAVWVLENARPLEFQATSVSASGPGMLFREDDTDTGPIV